MHQHEQQFNIVAVLQKKLGKNMCIMETGGGGGGGGWLEGGNLVFIYPHLW